jgi:hypothetical protein
MDNGTPETRTPADKERSRQQSRSVSGREAARTVGGKKPRTGGSGQRPPGSRDASGTKAATAKPSGTKTQAPKGSVATKPATKATPAGGRPPKGGQPTDRQRPSGRTAGPRRSPTALLTWGTVAVVLVIVVVLVVVKVTGSNNSGNVSSAFVPASATVVHNATNIPASVYDEVGINSPVPITPPLITKNQPLLKIDGKPGVFYYGAEYCPYCAAERWPIVASLSRFGKFANLGEMESTSTDVFPNTPTFTFLKAGFTSPYIGLKTEEYESNVKDPAGGFTILQRPTPEEQKLIGTYDSTKYFPANTSGPTFPLVDFGNQALINGASFSPSILQGLTRDQIAADLSDPTNPVTQAIVATSNYMSASTCHITNQQPASVCTSKGVTEAAKALHLQS